MSLARRASADEPPLELTWSAPGECASADDVRREVARLVAGTSAPTLRARVRIERRERGYASHLETGGGFERTVVGASCEAVVEATTVILALAIDPSAASRLATRASPSASASAVGAVPIEAARVPTPGASSSASRAEPVVEVGARVQGSAGALPHTDAGVSAHADVVGRGWSGGVEATYWFGERATIAGANAVGGDFSWTTGAVHGCVAPYERVVRLDVCAGPEMGRFAGQGVGVSQQASPAALWVAGTATVVVRAPLSRHLGLDLSGGPGFVFVGRHSYVVDGTTTVFRPSLVSARLGLGAYATFLLPTVDSPTGGPAPAHSCYG